MQGGINLGENVLQAFPREISEELKLNPGLIRVQLYFGSGTIDSPPNRKNREDFTKGKIYFIFSGEYTGTEEFELKTDELSAAEWVTAQTARELLKTTRKEKAEFATKLLDQLLASDLKYQ